MAQETTAMNHGLLEGLIEALSDKQSEVDLRLQDVTLALGDPRIAIRLSGTVTVSIHMRDLTDSEKDAHAAATVARLHA